MMIALVWLAVLAVGAKRVVSDRARWLRHRRQARRTWMDWHRSLAGEMDPKHCREWSEVAARDPELMIQACSVQVDVDR